MASFAGVDPILVEYDSVNLIANAQSVAFGAHQAKKLELILDG